MRIKRIENIISNYEELPEFIKDMLNSNDEEWLDTGILLAIELGTKKEEIEKLCRMESMADVINNRWRRTNFSKTIQ